MKIKALVVDDEVSSRNVLSKLLEKFCPEIEVVSHADHIESAYQAIQELHPDLVFLDVQMPGGNGFSLLKKFEKIPFEIIFVTGYDQYALHAIKFSALDYLLKPVEVEDLLQAVKRAKMKITGDSNSRESVSNLLANENEEEIHRRIAVHDKGKVRFIKLNEIVWLEADANYTILHLAGGEKYSTSKSLKEYEELFENTPLFLRVNKSAIVSVNFVKAYSKKDPFTLTLLNDVELEISRRKRQEVSERLKSM